MCQKAKRIVLITSIVLVLIGALLYCIPWPTKLDLQFHGVEVTEDGQVLAQGEIIVQGWEFNYLFRKDSVRLTKAQFLSDVFSTDSEHSLVIYEAPTSCETIFGHMYLAADNSYKEIRIDLHPEQEWAVVQISGRDTYLIGSEKADFDPDAILSTWKSLQS